MKILLNIIFYILIGLSANSTLARTTKQIDKARFVLEKAIKNKPFVFGKWTQEGGTENRLVYLGEFKTKRGKTYKVLTSEWTWGQSGRKTSRILIYDKLNRYIGNYYLPMDYDLPDKLLRQKLIFISDSKDCDKNKQTVIDLSSGLPKQIIIKCNGEYGDVSVFESS